MKTVIIVIILTALFIGGMLYFLPPDEVLRTAGKETITLKDGEKLKVKD